MLELIIEISKKISTLNTVIVSKLTCLVCNIRFSFLIIFFIDGVMNAHIIIPSLQLTFQTDFLRQIQMVKIQSLVYVLFQNFYLKYFFIILLCLLTMVLNSERNPN
jgi:hypothetical protein